jgi:ATP-dependent RNA helicase DHX57
VLLGRLANEGQIGMFSEKSVTHLIVDEVRERSCETDFMLTFLRQVIEQRPKLRVVLMSATMDAECFLKYFSIATASMTPMAPPLLVVTGRCFPTEEIFLDAIQAQLGHRGTVLGMSPDEIKRDAPRSLSESDGIDYDLICEILTEIDSSPEGAWRFVPGHVGKGGPKIVQEGAVLIFMPGAGEIAQMIATLEDYCKQAYF